VLGWEPTVPLAEGLGRTIAWFRASLLETDGAEDGAELDMVAAQ
jgi:hypothetical protein